MLNHLHILALGLIASPFSYAQQGCMDPAANNYNPSATIENHTCQYTVETLTFTASQEQLLPNYLRETSGLAYYNGLHWTHNDDSSSKIYGYNPTTAEVEDSINLGIQVQDWE